MFMPTGEAYLLLKNGKYESIMLTDEVRPKEFIMNDEYVLKAVKRVGYENIEEIVYERNNHKTIVSMAEYYYEKAKELE